MTNQIPPAESPTPISPLPLGKPKLLGEKQAYDFYVGYCAQNKIEQVLSLADWRAATRAGNLALRSLLVVKGQMVQLPHRLGKLIIYRKKVDFDRPAVNWKLTKATGKRVFHINEHSNFFKAFTFWEKITCNFRYQSFYKFLPVRDFSRAIAQIMLGPDGYRQYRIKPEPNS
jgi:hypothetical protein